MAERRTRQHDSPRRRKGESTKAIIDQDEIPRTRTSYKPTELSSSYSSSSSYIDISRTFPLNRPRGLGAIRAFFTAPSEHRRRPRRRTSRPFLRAGNSSSSSINTDLAYGSGYVRRRKGDRARRKGKEREFGGRSDPRADVDPDAAILEVGAGLAAIARKQNRLDQAEARRQGFLPPKRGDSGGFRGLESSRGLGSSKISHGPDEDGWESATDADSETSSVDSRLAYGHDNGRGWGFGFSIPKRKDSVVDPALFGPANSLHGIIQEPVGFGDVDHDDLSDYPPPTIAALQREQSVVSASASAIGPLQHVYPVPTSDPTRFDAARSSLVSAQELCTSRPAPVPIQQASIPIQQPQPKPVVSQSVFERSYSAKSEPNVPTSSGRTKSSVAGAALAGVTGAAIGAGISSERRDERKNKDRRLEEIRDQYDRDRGTERLRDEPRERPDAKEGADDRRERRRERGRDESGESREGRRERRRREARDDPDHERHEKRREKRRDDDVPDDRAGRRREGKDNERTDDRDDEKRSRKDAPIIPPIDPFQYQVADDAFKTPDGTRNSEPFTSIQRARSPAVVTVERVPHWHRDSSAKEKTVKPVDEAEKEKDREARDRHRTEREAESIYKEIEHSTIPVEASAVGAAIAAEEHRHSREKVRKRRYDRGGDSSPNREHDPIQEEADRIYREAVLARKIAESKNDDPVIRVVTPPEMAHKAEILYPVPNADFELDHVMDPMEFMTSPIKTDQGFDRTKSISGVAVGELKRPLLTLVRPTPTPSPNPEKQETRSKRKDSSREAEPSESKKSKSAREQSSRDMEPAGPNDRRSEREESSRDMEPSETRNKPARDPIITETRGDAVQTPTSANGSKGVTWGQNDTKHYEVESPYETKDDPIASSVKASGNQGKPKMSKERKASAWGALKGAFMSGAAAEVVAKAAEVSTNEEDVKPERNRKDTEPTKEEEPESKENLPAIPFEYRGVVVEPELSDAEVRERGPPAIGPKPPKVPGSNMPGAFNDDLDFTAILAAGLEDSGFDPNIVIKDPTYRRRSSPPGSQDLPLAGYKQPYAESVLDLSQYAAPSTERARDLNAQNDDGLANDRAQKEQKKLDKATERQRTEARNHDLPEQTPVTSQLVEEPDSFLESSKSNKKDNKRDKSQKLKDSHDEGDDRSSKSSTRVSVPVDAFDDLRAEAVSVDSPGDGWDIPKKSKRKPKRDSDLYDSPSRSMSASDMTSSVEQSKKKSKSSKKSPQYDSEPNPEDVLLPTASEASKDDDYDSRKSRKSSKRSSSISDIADRDPRSVRSSDSYRYGDEDSRSSKKEKKNSGFFGGIFGSSTSKSEPEPRDAEESTESKKKSKKSKRTSAADSSEIYGDDVKSDLRTSQNGNGYENHDGENDDFKKSINGDAKPRKADEKEESFLDNAGTLGAGVGLAAAIALAAQHQQSKAAIAEIEERAPRSSTSDLAVSTIPPTVEDSREVFEEDVVDPEIIQRRFRPSIDPQYGDLLPLPPSDPGSPSVELVDALPSLPESRPGTPPETENTPPRGRSVGSSRRSELPALVKTPSHSAVPIKFIMGNRSTPSSPGMVRAPSITSPSAMSPDTLGHPRVRPRPKSWDSTKEIQPLYLLDPSRRGPPSQSTDSEVPSPAGEDSARSTQIDSSMHVPEVSEETPSSDVRDFAEEPQLASSKTHVQDDQILQYAPPTDFPDPTATPSLPRSRTPTSVGLGTQEFDRSSLPPLPKSETSTPAYISGLSGLPPLSKSGTSTPADSSYLSRLPQLPESRSATPAEDQPLQDSDLAAAGLLSGAALGLSAGFITLASSHGESSQVSEPALKSVSAEEIPTEFHIEPITKDRSSYLFQATPPAKQTKDVNIQSPLETRRNDVGIPSQTVEEVSPTDDITTLDDCSPTRLIIHDREAALEALTGPRPENKEPAEPVTIIESISAKEAEVDAGDEFVTKSKKNKKKDKKKQNLQLDPEDLPSSNTVMPPPMVDASKDVEGPPEFSLKRSKKDKKKDKKKALDSDDPNGDTFPSTVILPPVASNLKEVDTVDEPSKLLSEMLLPSSIEPAGVADPNEEFSLKKSKKDKKKDKKKALDWVEDGDDMSSVTVLPPSVFSAAQEADPSDDYSSATTNKDKKNRKSLSRSSTLVEPNLDKPTETFDGKDDMLARAEDTPLPLSRALSEASDIDTKTGDILPSRQDSRQIAEPFVGPVSAKESKKSKKKSRKSLQSWEFNEPPASEAVPNNPITKASLERDVEAFGSESKDTAAIEDEPQREPQMDVFSTKESKKDKKRKSNLQQAEEFEEPSVSNLVEQEPLRDAPAEDEPVHKEIFQADSAREVSLLNEPVQMEKVERNPTRELSVPGDLGGEELGNRDFSIEDSTAKDIIVTEDHIQSKPFEHSFDSDDSKESKKGKKNDETLNLQAWQEDEVAESQPTSELVSEPITEAPSEREGLSGFSTPTSKSKGKRKQKRKSIAWDVSEPEIEPPLEAPRSIAEPASNTGNAPEQAYTGKEAAEVARQEPEESTTLLHDFSKKEKIGHTQGTQPSKEEKSYEPDVVTREVERSSPHAGLDAFSATPIESEQFDTARTDFSSVEYFPSAAALHLPWTPKELGETNERGYFPSAASLLPGAAPTIALATQYQARDIDSTDRSCPEDASLPVSTTEQTGSAAVHNIGMDTSQRQALVEEFFTHPQNDPHIISQPASLPSMQSHPELAATEDLPKQSHIDYYPSAAFLHSPYSAGPSGGDSAGGYFPSAITLLPLLASAPAFTGEQHLEQENLLQDVQDGIEPHLSRSLEPNKQPVSVADHEAAETANCVFDKNTLYSRSETPDERGAGSTPPAAYSEEQSEAARQLNAEFGPGKKKFKKNKKGRANLSRTSIQDDDFPMEVPNEPEEIQQQVELDRETQTINELETADGLAADYGEDQVLLAKQLQAEFDSDTKKPKKGKKNRSTSRTPKDYESGPSFFEETQAPDYKPAEEVSREVIPEDEDASKKQGPGGLAAGLTPGQFEIAQQMSEDFTTGSKKSKKDKKRKGLIRSATDENFSGPATENVSEETSLPTTEVDSATDSPYHLSTVPTPDDLESPFTTNKGKKGEKKRQSLLGSFTQDGKESAGPSREITEEPEPMQLESSDRDIPAAGIASDPILDPQDRSPSAVAEEPEAFSSSTKKAKKGNKKRQGRLRAATRDDEPSSDPASGVMEQEAIQKDIAEANMNQLADVIADNDLTALGEELNLNLKKSKEREGKDINEILVETEAVSQITGQGVVEERDLASKSDRDQESLADRIWADVMPSESVQSKTETPSAESEDPLGFYTTKKPKKSKKGQSKPTQASELEAYPLDRVAGVPAINLDGERKEPPLSWAEEVAESEKKSSKKLFDTWNFGNLPLDNTAQQTSAQEPQTASKDAEIVHNIKQEIPVKKSGAPLLPGDYYSQESYVQEHQKSAMVVNSVNIPETPPPVMPEALAWEDEITQQEQQLDVKPISTTSFSIRTTERPGDSHAKAKTKYGVANPVSVGIVAAGAALLAGVSVGHSKEPTEVTSFSGIPHSATEKKEPDTSRPVGPKKKKGKEQAKFVDRRFPSKDDLFDDPVLWEGPEAPKFDDHMLEDEAEDDTGFWSASIEQEEDNRDDFAVDAVGDGPSSMPHKRERSESLLDVWEPSTVLESIKTPRKHQYEDVPAAMARDIIMEQEIAEEHPMRADNLNRDASEDEPTQTNTLNSVLQQIDVPEENLIQLLKKAKNNKKPSRLGASDTLVENKEADVAKFYTTTIDPPISGDFDAAPVGDQRTSTVNEATEDHVPDRYADQEIHLPTSSTIPRTTADESFQQRDLNIAPPQHPSEDRTKDKHRRQESSFPPPSTLPIVIEEEYHKPSDTERGLSESEHISRDGGINANNRDSALVTESPVPFQRRFAEDHEYARDSGVHLRDWGDTPVSKDKPHVDSSDDALACLSWPAVNEDTETVDLKRSQRLSDKRSPKGHATSPALAGAGAPVVTELSHLTARSTPKNKDEHGDKAKVDRSITPNIGRLQTPDHAKYRPGSGGSNQSSIRSSGTPPLRRSDRKFSGDLRSLSQRSQANLAKDAKDGKEVEGSPATSIVNINPTANEGRVRVKDMADVYDGYGEGRIGSPMSPTRPHSMRRRQSMQVLDLEARVEQLATENRMLAEAKELAEHSLQSSQRATLTLADREAEVDSLKQTLDWLHREVERLKEVNDGLTSANITLGRQHNERYGALETQHGEATRELEDIRQTHGGLSAGMDDVVLERVVAATEEKDREIAQLRRDLEAAHERIREMQREILLAKDNDSEFLVFRDEDYFDNACQQLCQHVQQWVLRFSKFSDMRACRRTNEINNDKIIDRLDNAVLDGSDVDDYLSDRIKRRDIFMSMTMTMIWEFVFTRYLFGMDREQRQKLKSLEKTLLEVGPPAAVHQWRATTLTLLSKRDAFQQQREQDTMAVVQMVFQTLSEILPPPSHLEEQIQDQLMRVMKAAVDLSIEMRTQRAEYMMLPPLQPEYDANGDLARQVQFNAALMNERSGDTVSNEELQTQHAVVMIVLFPLVVKKGDDTGGGEDEIVVCPAQVLVAKPKRHARGLTPEGLGQNPNHSGISMQSSMPIDQQVPDI